MPQCAAWLWLRNSGVEFDHGIVAKLARRPFSVPKPRRIGASPGVLPEGASALGAGDEGDAPPVP